ncbi:hypothetical protein DBV15_08424 [Temnothorax longispinosus]|uniref:Uncharacterized protein n=1 Tax=Temnothorax longispinosus TaxID=300112 RepID=A0A4S2L752_9HYME|nr:hypothetical protein DBV15_08424 [Temnothorax longispinosus]
MELTKDSISVNPSSANCDIHCAYRFNNAQRKRKKYMHLLTLLHILACNELQRVVFSFDERYRHAECSAAVFCRAAPRGETVDGRQCCNDGELASLRYHGGRIRLYVAATSSRNSRIAATAVTRVAGGRICSRHAARRTISLGRGGGENQAGETEGLFRPRTEHRTATAVSAACDVDDGDVGDVGVSESVGWRGVDARWSSPLLLRPSPAHVIVVVGPELILSFNGTYRVRAPFAFTGDLLLPVTRPASPHPPTPSNPKLIVHEYHNQGCTLYRTRAAHHHPWPSHERVPEQTELAGFTTWFVATRMSFPDPQFVSLTVIHKRRRRRETMEMTMVEDVKRFLVFIHFLLSSNFGYRVRRRLGRRAGFSNALTHPRVFSIKASLSTTMERIFTVRKCKESPRAILRIALGVTLRNPRRFDRATYSDIRNETIIKLKSQRGRGCLCDLEKQKRKTYFVDKQRAASVASVLDGQGEGVLHTPSTPASGVRVPHYHRVTQIIRNVQQKNDPLMIDLFLAAKKTEVGQVQDGNVLSCYLKLNESFIVLDCICYWFSSSRFNSHQIGIAAGPTTISKAAFFHLSGRQTYDDLSSTVVQAPTGRTVRKFAAFHGKYIGWDNANAAHSGAARRKGRHAAIAAATGGNRGCLVRSYSRCIIDAILSRPEGRAEKGHRAAMAKRWLDDRVAAEFDKTGLGP